MSNLSSSTPIEIDTELARIWEEQQKVSRYIESYRATLARWDAEGERARAKGHKAFHPQYRSYQEQVEEYAERLDGLEYKAAPFEAEYSARPWRRFFLVTNQNGHIHTSMSCSTCFHDTLFAWLPQYSGMTDEEIVALEAYRCCTVCMPIAPAEQKAARQAHTKAQREAKAAERQAKKDAKAAKGRERAVKHVDKVMAEIEKMGGVKAFTEDFSLHGHDGRRSVYNWRDHCPTMVGDTLYAIKQAQETRLGYHHNINEFVVEELTNRGVNL